VYDRNMIVYHGTKSQFDKFDIKKAKSNSIFRSFNGFHFGSIKQACAISTNRIVAARLNMRNYAQVRDVGCGWAKKMWNAKSRGKDGLLYLNRFEGIELMQLINYVDKMESPLNMNYKEFRDSLTDKEFIKLYPLAEYSYVVFYPEQIDIIGNVDVERATINGILIGRYRSKNKEVKK